MTITIITHRDVTVEIFCHSESTIMKVREEQVLKSHISHKTPPLFSSFDIPTMRTYVYISATFAFLPFIKILTRVHRLQIPSFNQNVFYAARHFTTNTSEAPTMQGCVISDVHVAGYVFAYIQ